jgi:hypothetical protein
MLILPLESDVEVKYQVLTHAASIKKLQANNNAANQRPANIK